MESLIGVDFPSRGAVDSVRSDSCTFVLCIYEVVFAHRETILGHIGVCLQLLLYHIHLFHSV